MKPDRDSAHEAHVRRLFDNFLFALEAGDKEKARYLWPECVRAVSERSPKQIEKMEKEQGLR